MLPREDIDRLVEACSDAAGDDLRSVVCFTADEYEQTFLRDYLSADADIQTFVDNERAVFDRRPTHEGSELGRYEYTIRRFEHGYLTTVVVGSTGAFATTNRLPIDRFDSLARAIAEVLREWEA